MDAGIDDVAIVTLTLTPKPEATHFEDDALYRVAENVQVEIAKLEDVGLSYIVGGSPGPDPRRTRSREVGSLRRHAFPASRQGRKCQSCLPSWIRARRRTQRDRRCWTDSAGHSRYRPACAVHTRWTARLCSRRRKCRGRGRSLSSTACGTSARPKVCCNARQPSLWPLPSARARTPLSFPIV